MPIEYERKIILKDAGRLREALLAAGLRPMAFEQFYLNDHARFRRVRADDGTVRYLFTYKQAIGGKLLELENEISGEDYGLAREGAISSLRKERFVLEGEDGNRWEVDFILDSDGGIRFGLAEVELEEWAPWAIPVALEPYVDVVVPHGDNALFSNVRLADAAYASDVVRLYRETIGSNPSGEGSESGLRGARRIVIGIR